MKKKTLHNSASLSLLMLLAIAGCKSKGETSSNENLLINGDTIQVRDQSNLQSMLSSYVVQSEMHKPELIASGIVKAIPNLYAEIAPPFSGRVTSVHLRLGLRTKPGTPLFEISSPEFTDAQKIFFQAKAEYQQAGLALKRQQDLKANGVGSEKDVEEAATNYEVKLKDYQNATASLRIYNTDMNTLVFGQPLVIRSPIAGEVITNEVVMGQYIKAEDPPRAKIAELSKVWVVGMIKEKDLQAIHQLQTAEISVAAFPGTIIKGRVYHIDQIVNEETRSVQVLIECSNDDHTLKPGMYVSVKFIETASMSIFIPANSLLQYNDKSYVLLQTGRNKYVKRYVETGTTEAGRVQIHSGLSAGETIISEGAFYLIDAK